ncbi:MAG: peptidase M23, partial [Gemmatimonadetes bacterium]
MLLVLLTACDTVDGVRNELRDLTPHETYAEALAAAGLANTRLARAWHDAARRALPSAPVVTPPYEEEGVFFADQPEARAYRLRLRRGQELQVRVALDSTRSGRLFLDVFRLPDDSARAPLPLVSGDSARGLYRLVASRTADYAVRLQPELLVDGRYTLSLAVDASLAFPVEGRSTRSIQSVFGDPREGGRRSHHGVDIFAPRWTPVLSASDGVVARVRETPIGGRVVWVRDADAPQSLYYAHLQQQTVREGQRVRRGDTLGFVGNTGNARTTPPHLHFGVYVRGRGPVDPWYYLWRPDRTPPARTAPLDALGAWTRTAGPGLRL